MNAPITFAICGFGDRGSTYAGMQELFPARMKVVAVADLNPAKVQKPRSSTTFLKKTALLAEKKCLQRRNWPT